MSFYPQKKEEFLNSLKNIKINRSPEETFIKSFTPDGLSNLYDLFFKLKDILLDDECFDYLSNIISSHYSEEIVNSLHNPITNTEINQLLEIMKQEYLEIVNRNNPKKISPQEQERLKCIINKHYSSVFLDFIKKPISTKQFFLQIKQIRDAIIQLSDAYYNQVSPHGQQNLDYVSSAIYLIFRKIAPELSITEPNRGKGFNSFLFNIHKELNKGLQKTVPHDIEIGITLDDLKKNIVSNSENPNNFTDKTNADFSGITIVLNQIDDSIYFDENDPENTELLILKKQRNDNVKFTHSIKKYLNENDIFLTQEEYFQIYIELLRRLQDCTYPECTHEIREGNYSSKLEYAITTYKKIATTNSFASKATDDEIEELYDLTDSLNYRLDDKLENEILRVTFPHVLDDPLLKEDFKITGKFVKFVKKENGFCAIYFELIDALGRKIEVQLQSNMRYKETKNGISSHNDMPGKKVNIDHFFELTDGRDAPELLKSYLSLLGRTSKKQEDSLRQKLKKLQNEKTSCTISPEEKRQLDNSVRKLQKKIEIIENARNNIKIKDVFIEDVDMIDIENTMKEDNSEIMNLDGKRIKVYNTKTQKRISKMTIKQYLLSFAQYHSPVSMKVISSAHATAPEAYVNKKTLVESFTEILRRGDEITYLSELLIDKLKELLNLKNINQISYEDLKRYSTDSKNGFYAPQTSLNDTNSKEDHSPEI